MVSADVGQLMRTNLANALLEDDSPTTVRVMRAYWLAPRVSRPATIIALTSSTTTTTTSHDLTSRRTFTP
jgi:hypothetical protein